MRLRANDFNAFKTLEAYIKKHRSTMCTVFWQAAVDKAFDAMAKEPLMQH